MSVSAIPASSSTSAIVSIVDWTLVLDTGGDGSNRGTFNTCGHFWNSNQTTVFGNFSSIRKQKWDVTRQKRENLYILPCWSFCRLLTGVALCRGRTRSYIWWSSSLPVDELTVRHRVCISICFRLLQAPTWKMSTFREPRHDATTRWEERGVEGGAGGEGKSLLKCHSLLGAYGCCDGVLLWVDMSRWDTSPCSCSVYIKRMGLGANRSAGSFRGVRSRTYLVT